MRRLLSFSRCSIFCFDKGGVSSTCIVEKRPTIVDVLRIDKGSPGGALHLRTYIHNYGSYHDI